MGIRSCCSGCLGILAVMGLVNGAQAQHVHPYMHLWMQQQVMHRHLLLHHHLAGQAALQHHLHQLKLQQIHLHHIKNLHQQQQLQLAVLHHHAKRQMFPTTTLKMPAVLPLPHQGFSLGIRRLPKVHQAVSAPQGGGNPGPAGNGIFSSGNWTPRYDPFGNLTGVEVTMDVSSNFAPARHFFFFLPRNAYLNINSELNRLDNQFGLGPYRATVAAALQQMSGNWRASMGQ